MTSRLHLLTLPRQVSKMPQSTWASIARGPQAPASSLGHQSAQGHHLHTATSQPADGRHSGKPVPQPDSAVNQQSTPPPPLHQRKDAHRPRTAPRTTQQAHQTRSGQQHAANGAEDEEDCYVLTLLTDGRHHADMSALRRQWFPPKLLKVDAHVTLFHALPASRLDRVRADLGAAAARTARFPVRVQPRGVFRMGKGVGVEIDRESLMRVRALREGLRARWNGEEGEMYDGEGEGWLSEQDARRGWKGHYTVMNKENEKERKEACYEELSHEWKGSKGFVNGLTLWRYDRGWWKKSEDFLFRDHMASK